MEGKEGRYSAITHLGCAPLDGRLQALDHAPPLSQRADWPPVQPPDVELLPPNQATVYQTDSNSETKMNEFNTRA